MASGLVDPGTTGVTRLFPPRSRTKNATPRQWWVTAGARRATMGHRPLGKVPVGFRDGRHPFFFRRGGSPRKKIANRQKWKPTPAL